MILSFEYVFKIKGNDLHFSMEAAAMLMRDYLIPETKMVLGRRAGAWFWQIELPQQHQISISSEIQTLIGVGVPFSFNNYERDKWWILNDRPWGKGNSPFSRTITKLIDLPYESIFAIIPGDFIVYIEYPKDDNEVISGLKDVPRKLLVMSNNKNIAERLSSFFDAKTYPADPRKRFQISFFAGLTELHYIFRVPLYNDTLVPHLLNTPNNIPSYLEGNPNILQRGLLIAGLPGSGKTTTLKKILHNVIKSKKLESLFIADVKGEYEQWCKVENITYLAIGKKPEDITNLRINIFIPSDNLRIASHIDALALLFAIGNSGGGGVLLPSYFKILLEEYYIALLWQRLKKHDWPSDIFDQRLRILNLTGKELSERLNNDISCFNLANHGLVQFWKIHKDTFIKRVFGNGGNSNGRAEIEDVIASRISFFETSVLQYFTYNNGRSMDKLLKEQICVSFQGFSKPTLQLLISTFAILCFETILAGIESTHLKHLFVFEEAHLVAGVTSNSIDVMTVEKLISDSIERALAEGRSKGLGNILIDQQPGTRLVPSVLANTNLKICHNLLGADSELMAKAMCISNGTDFSYLSVGEAYVKISDDLPAYKTRIMI